MIERERLLTYALDPGYDDGGHKARVLDQVLGFNRMTVDLFIAATREGIRSTPARRGRVDQYGSHYRVDISMSGPSGRQAIVRTGWVYRPGEEIPVLTTAFVRRRRRDAQATIP